MSKSDTNRKNWLQTVSPKFYVEKWDCPLSNAKGLYFEGVIAFDKVQFYFTDKTNTTYAVSIPRLSPIRIVGESELVAVYSPIQDKAEALGIPMSRAWKVWNSKFIEEVNYENAVFLGASEQDKFQYFIASDDECVEFISGKVEIDIFKGKHFMEVVRKDFGRAASFLGSQPKKI